MYAVRIKCALGQQPDMELMLYENDTVGDMLRQIRVQTGWHAKHIRLIAGGRELRAWEPLSAEQAPVIHCIATDTMPLGTPAPKQTCSPVSCYSVEHSPTEWLDTVDPGTVLMWIFGCILALLWLLVVCYARLFDRTSMAMLCMMTIAFLIPATISCMPCLANLSAQAGSQFGPVRPRERSSVDLAIGRSTAVAQQWPAEPAMASIPPRPLAPVLRSA